MEEKRKAEEEEKHVEEEKRKAEEDHLKEKEMLAEKFRLEATKVWKEKVLKRKLRDQHLSAYGGTSRPFVPSQIKRISTRESSMNPHLDHGAGKKRQTIANNMCILFVRQKKQYYVP